MNRIRPRVAGRSTSPTRCPGSTRCCASASSAASSTSSPRTCAMGATDVAVFEIGKGYGTGDHPDRPTREWWRLAFALTGAAEAPAWNRAARPYDLDDAKGLVELLASRLGRPAVAYDAPERTIRPCIRAARRPSGPTGSWSGGSASCIRRCSTSSSCGPIGSSSARSPSPDWPPDAWSMRRSATPSRHPDVERDLAVVVSTDRPAAVGRGGDRRARRRPPPVRHPVRQLPGQAARRARGQPGLPPGVRGRGSDADGGRGRDRRRCDHGRPGGRCRRAVSGSERT